ncbi:cytochrome b5-like [Lineus longissimus]|uniref:cytochrome b5-like n=1 Tax=Lineus longissimus TaxID=88925 RepID=UPI002B4C5A43
MEKWKEHTRDEVSAHCTFSSCWIIMKDKVYDVTTFVRKHPGGEDILLENAGGDVTSSFVDKGHSQEAYKLLEGYCIGILVEHERLE